jgi:hypothetical protein
MSYNRKVEKIYSNLILYEIDNETIYAILNKDNILSITVDIREDKFKKSFFFLKSPFVMKLEDQDDYFEFKAFNIISESYPARDNRNLLNYIYGLKFDNAYCRIIKDFNLNAYKLQLI